MLAGANAAAEDAPKKRSALLKSFMVVIVVRRETAAGCLEMSDVMMMIPIVNKAMEHLKRKYIKRSYE